MTKNTAEFLLDIINNASVRASDDNAVQALSNILQAKKELVEILVASVEQQPNEQSPL